MLEINSAFLINMVIWGFIVAGIFAIFMIGWQAIQYQQFASAMQQTLARTGSFHVNAGPHAREANYINNPAILSLMDKYDNKWVIEPVPNLAAYNGTTLTSDAVEFLIGKSQMRHVNLTDFENLNGSRKLANTMNARKTGVEAAYFYNKKDPYLGTTHFDQTQQEDLASQYNTGSALHRVAPRYLDLTNFDANWLVKQVPAKDGLDAWTNGNPNQANDGGASEGQQLTGSLYNPKQANVRYNGIVNFKANDGYQMAPMNLWNTVVMLNGNYEPRVKYAGQVAYLIVPNVNAQGKANTNALVTGLGRLAMNIRNFNSDGRPLIVTNQIRSLDRTFKTN